MPMQMMDDQPLAIGGKTIKEWDRLWIRVPTGLQEHQGHLTREFGLYRYMQNRVPKALGVGTDRRGGIAKRLSDFIRPSRSGRSHHAGQLIYEHRRQLTVEVLITGDDRLAREIAHLLKAPMMALHRPPWSLLDRVYARTKARKPARIVKSLKPGWKPKTMQQAEETSPPL